MGNLIERLGAALLSQNNLQLRSLLQEALTMWPRTADWPFPDTKDQRVVIASAAVAELHAMHTNQVPPPWTESVGSIDPPMHVVPSAATMKRLRDMCETDSPLPFRKRGFYAPPNFLEFA